MLIQRVMSASFPYLPPYLRLAKGPPVGKQLLLKVLVLHLGLLSQGVEVLGKRRVIEGV